MAKNAKAHQLVDQDIHRAVAQDKQPRDAVHTTTYDDGSKAETVHKLYWHVHKDHEGKETGEVRSMPLEEWPGHPPLEMPEPPPLPWPGAVVHFVLDTIERHVAATVTATPYTNHYTVDLAVFNHLKKRVEWWEGVPYDEERARIGSWHWADVFFQDRPEPHAVAVVEPVE